jgi:hypothetical protein
VKVFRNGRLLKRPSLFLAGNFARAAAIGAIQPPKLRATAVRDFLALMAGICRILVWLLGVVIYLATVAIAYLVSFHMVAGKVLVNAIAVLATIALPFVGQIYWILYISLDGALINPLTVACLGWVALVIVSRLLSVAALSQTHCSFRSSK